MRVRWAIEDPNPKAKVEAKEEAEAKFLQAVLSDPQKHSQLIMDTQSEHDLNAYYKNNDTAVTAAPWLYDANGQQLPAPPPPPPRRKKKGSKTEAGKSVSVALANALKQVEPEKIKETLKTQAKPSLSLVADYGSDED
jgi:hypothetical protein